ncbi:MAG: STAS/SEC14 domain-containing protein [Bdellovibrionales bacterium]
MITTYIDKESFSVEITIAGKISESEIKECLEEIDGPLEEWPQIRILKRIDSFSGMELMALVENLKFAFQNFSHYKKIQKTALVSDNDWIVKIAEFAENIVPGEMKIFENEDIEKARAWLK